MNDYLSLLPSTLQWVSMQLGSVSSIPWPFWIGGLFPLYVAVLSFVLWFLRGRVWPLLCDYPKTSKGRPCRMMVAGEWARCRHHNRRRTYNYGHEVQKIRRWQTFGRRGEIVERGQKGVGMLRLRPAGSSLLYVRGYARPPLDVLKLIPEKVRDGAYRLKQARLTRSPGVAHTEPGSVPETRPDLAEGLERVVRATRFAAASFCVAIVLALLAVILGGVPQTVVQYFATLGFVLAWAATYSGLYLRSTTWLRGACSKAAKWWAITFVPVGFLNLMFTAINKTPA